MENANLTTAKQINRLVLPTSDKRLKLHAVSLAIENEIDFTIVFKFAAPNFMQFFWLLSQLCL